MTSRPRRAASDGATSGASARDVAYRVLREVEEDGAYANLALSAALRDGSLSQADAGLVTSLVYGVLRWRGTIDALLAPLLSRGIEGTPIPVLLALRLGVFQLLWMEIPPHAAVDQSVRLARRHAGQRGAGLVNAVLRRVAEAGDLPAALAAAGLSEPSSPAQLAARYSHPEWIVNELAAALGLEWDDPELASALEANNVPATVTLVARPGLQDRAELLAQAAEGHKGGAVTPGRHSSLAVLLDGGASPGRIRSVRDGSAGVQDEASQCLCLAVAAVPIAGPDERWLDLCAGPGGKASLLQGLARSRGAEVTAVELHPHRAHLTEQALSGYPGSRVVIADARDAHALGRTLAASDAAIGLGAFDRVLVDAPCTGLGVLHRRAELRWRRRSGDIPGLVQLQSELLSTAWEMARPGGVIAYTTCTPVRAETDGVVATFCDEHPDAELIDASSLMPASFALREPGPTIRTWTHRDGTDSMFLALIRKGSSLAD